MVIDTSAVVAILFLEPEAQSFASAIRADQIRLMSAASALETAMVVEARHGPSGGREFDLFLHRAGIDIVPFSADQFELARRAWRLYGKGNHPAALNLGDCFAYALAKNTGEPLLFKGEDFLRTDVARAGDAR